jgi:tripartite-type tricarboxylate transporter receptor subunit TctC
MHSSSRPFRSSISRRQSLALGSALLAAPSLVLAQSNRPISLIVSYPAGGGADLMARLIAPHLSRHLGQNVVVDNKPGASGQIAASLVAKAAPDGNTLLLDASSFAVNPSLFPKLPYDSDKDFTPLGIVAQFPNVLVCHPGFEAKTVKDVLRLAKASPGKLAYASSGNGSAQHLAGALFESRTGAQLLHVPYRGGGPALNDVMAGQVPLFFANVASSLGHIQSGKLRPLAATSRRRARALPEIPSMEEAGIAGYEVLEWNPVFGPAGMPAATADRLRSAMRKAVAEPEVLGRIRSLSGEAFPDGPPALVTAFLKAQQSQWAKVIRERNITTG